MSQKDQALVYMEQARRYNNLKPHLASPAIPGLLVDVTTHHESREEKAFAEDATGHSGACAWPPRSSYSCSFCRREFRSAQALGGHMNVHRRDRARLKQYSSSLGQRGEQQDPPTVGAKHGQSRPFGPLVPGDQAVNPNPNPNSSVAEAPITRFSQPQHLTRGNVILISTNCFSSCITGDKFGLKNVPEEEQDLGSKEIRNGLRRWTDQGSRIKAITDCCSKRRRTEPTTTNLILNVGACSGGQKQGRAKDLLIDCNAVEELDLELRL